MTCLYDGMMQCKNKRADTNETHGETRKNKEGIWSSGLGVSQHSTTTKDLVPRSRMAPEGKRKRKTRGKTKLLLWQTSETKEPWKVEQIERKKTTKMSKVENTSLEKRNKEHYENLKVAKTWIKSLMDKIEFETTPVKTRWERKNLGSTPVEKRCKTW